MKKYVKLSALLLVFVTVLSLALSGCAFRKGELARVVASYPHDSAPGLMVKTENHWVSFLNVYGSKKYTLSVSTSADKTEPVYTATDVSIWFLDACDDFAVWCERSETEYTYMLYTFADKQTKVLKKVSTENYQPQNVGIYDGCVYYLCLDYAAKRFSVFKYNVEEQFEHERIHGDLDEGKQPYSFAIEGENFIFINSSSITVSKLTDLDTVFLAFLPSSVSYVYSASYDSTNQRCAIYYADSDSEDIGIIGEGETEVTSIFTFGNNNYAYQDKIRCADGHVYWISQRNATGNVTDHYTFVDYDYINHKPTEQKRAFSFFLDGDSIYFLRFDKDGSYDGIELVCKNR